MTDYIHSYTHPSDVYHREAVRVATKFFTDTHVDRGIVRWKSNGRVPPKDILALWKYLGYEGVGYDTEKSIAVSDEETAAFIAEYQRYHRGPDAKQIAEMRAAFGPGETVVNVITGERTKL